MYGVRQHPLYEATKRSYVLHGRLRECQCDCGTLILYSELALRSGNVKSCGCLRKLLLEQAYQQRLNGEGIKAKLKILGCKIRQAKRDLAIHLSMPVHMRDTPENKIKLDLIAATLRNFLAQAKELRGPVKKISPEEAARRRKLSYEAKQRWLKNNIL